MKIHKIKIIKISMINKPLRSLLNINLKKTMKKTNMDFRINNIIKYVGMEEDSVQIVYEDKDLSETQKFIERYIKSNFYKVLDGLVEDGKFERDELPKLEEVEVYRELKNQPHLYIEVLLSGNNKFGDIRIITNKILQTLNLDEFLFTVDFEEQSEN
jgi:hypothetical protein